MFKNLMKYVKKHKLIRKIKVINIPHEQMIYNNINIAILKIKDLNSQSNFTLHLNIYYALCLILVFSFEMGRFFRDANR